MAEECDRGKLLTSWQPGRVGTERWRIERRGESGREGKRKTVRAEPEKTR